MRIKSAMAFCAPLLSFAVAQAAGPDQQVKSANDFYYAAISARDSGKIETAWAHNDQVTNIFAVSPAPAVGWNAVKAAYENLFKRFPKITVSMPVPMIRMTEQEALVVGVETQEAQLPDGSVVNAKLPATNVFVKNGAEWVLIHHHTSRPPS